MRRKRKKKVFLPKNCAYHGFILYFTLSKFLGDFLSADDFCKTMLSFACAEPRMEDGTLEFLPMENKAAPAGYGRCFCRLFSLCPVFALGSFCSCLVANFGEISPFGVGFV